MPRGHMDAFRFCISLREEKRVKSKLVPPEERVHVLSLKGVSESVSPGEAVARGVAVRHAPRVRALPLPVFLYP